MIFDEYSEEFRDPTEEEVEDLMKLGVVEIITDALEDRDFVDYTTLRSLLRHPMLFTAMPAEFRKTLADVLLRNAPHLYPLAEEVAQFFSSFGDLSWKHRKRVRNGILASLKPKYGKWPPDYYMMWMLHVFGESDQWHHSPEFMQIFRNHSSDLVRRAAALAIAANGSRADALETRDRFPAASSLERLAILLATRKLGADERKHWKASLQLKGPLEKKI